MQGPCCQFFTRPARSGDQHRKLGARQAFELLFEFSDGAGGANDFARLVGGQAIFQARTELDVNSRQDLHEFRTYIHGGAGAKASKGADAVKKAVIRDVGPHLPEGVHLVPGHPVAGTENSGPESGFPELYEGRYCIITPPPEADEDAVAAVVEMWRKVGSIVEVMDAEHHDRVLAITSHLPHLIAYTIVGTANDLEEHLRRESVQNGDLVRTSEVIKYSAGGFRDFTRIAASDPVMWRDVFLNNKEAVLEVLGLFSEDLSALQRAIRRGKGDVLEDWFERTRTIRRGIIDMKQAGIFSAVEPEGGLDTDEPEGGLTSGKPEGGLTSGESEGGLTSGESEGE